MVVSAAFHSRVGPNTTPRLDGCIMLTEALDAILARCSSSSFNMARFGHGSCMMHAWDWRLGGMVMGMVR
jgi:hypothetical protein